jgi:hypothetical protein
MRSEVVIGMVALALVLPQCMMVTEGIEVDISYQAPPTPQAVQTDLGQWVRLDRALIALGRVELLRCDNFARTVWELFAPQRARAHEQSTPTSLGIPMIIDLMESSGSLLFAGTLRPPPGRYCGIRLVAAPADADAVGATAERAEMLESSVLLEGWIEHPNTGDEARLQARIAEPIRCEMAFDEPVVLDGPRSSSVSVQIGHLRWFDGIDFASLGHATAQQKLIENIESQMSATWL